jgi:hypothetical protein
MDEHDMIAVAHALAKDTRVSARCARAMRKAKTAHEVYEAVKPLALSGDYLCPVSAACRVLLDFYRVEYDAREALGALGLWPPGRSRSAGRTEVLLQALRDIVDPVARAHREAAAKGMQIDGQWLLLLRDDPAHLRDIARKALEAYEGGMDAGASGTTEGA